MRLAQRTPSTITSDHVTGLHAATFVYEVMMDASVPQAIFGGATTELRRMSSRRVAHRPARLRQSAWGDSMRRI